jgi:hypothetical protein
LPHVSLAAFGVIRAGRVVNREGRAGSTATLIRVPNREI